MDVRGPTRAAAKRLITGMVVACTAATLSAPAMGATVSNLHPPAPIPAPAAAKYTDDDVTGSPSTVKLVSDGPSHNLQVTDSVKLETVTGGLDGENTCDPTTTDPLVTNPSFLCPLATAMNVNLGAGDDTLAVGDNMPPLDVNGGPGKDRLDLRDVTAPATIDLGATSAAVGLKLASVEDVTGTAGDDNLTGDADANSLDGAGGRNTLRGGDGNDTLQAGADSAGDVLVGDGGTDTFVGAASTNILALDKAPDVITCSADRTDTVVADLGVNGIRDEITNPDACGTVTGPVRVGTSTAGAGTTTSETLQPIIVVPRLGSIAPVLAPGTANVADLTPPGASMRTFSRQRIATVLGKAKGVRVRVTCKESCGISIALSVDRATAKRLKLDTRTTPVVIGTATATRIVAGSTVLKVKLTRKAKAALKASKRNVTANTQVLVSDASGNGTLLSRHVTLVR